MPGIFLIKYPWLLGRIIRSFEVTLGIGLPIGNVTSQLFANIYLDRLDQFVKHSLKEKYYLRYCDDFILLTDSPDRLQELVKVVSNFLEKEMSLSLHPDKVIIRK